ncbi:hypothetical protein IQ31_04971 [Sphingobacterium siyangense]|uniref:Uncharacterized protein n=2 Tax=Sphingobacterium siyangense TaxID=459529 RepID=A0A562M7A9_9SPHI|nr:hypothetical protein IQ31_04971 [Sphingobacterium siyangense]
MFRKITSNRPDSSVLKEISKEFYTYFRYIKMFVRCRLIAYPRQVYILMILCITISICCFFLLPKPMDVKTTKSAHSVKPVSDGMAHIMGSISDLKEIIELQAIMDGLSTKRNLDKQDSLILIQIKERLFALENLKAKDSISSD